MSIYSPIYCKYPCLFTRINCIPKHVSLNHKYYFWHTLVWFYDFYLTYSYDYNYLEMPIYSHISKQPLMVNTNLWQQFVNVIINCEYIFVNTQNY